jgi:hypothetical protein
MPEMKKKQRACGTVAETSLIFIPFTLPAQGLLVKKAGRYKLM